MASNSGTVISGDFARQAGSDNRGSQLAIIRNFGNLPGGNAESCMAGFCPSSVSPEGTCQYRDSCPDWKPLSGATHDREGKRGACAYFIDRQGSKGRRRAGAAHQRSDGVYTVKTGWKGSDVADTCGVQSGHSHASGNRRRGISLAWKSVAIMGAAMILAAAANFCATGYDCPDEMTLLASLDIYQLSMIKAEA